MDSVKDDFERSMSEVEAGIETIRKEIEEQFRRLDYNNEQKLKKAVRLFNKGMPERKLKHQPAVDFKPTLAITDGSQQSFVADSTTSTTTSTTGSGRHSKSSGSRSTKFVWKRRKGDTAKLPKRPRISKKIKKKVDKTLDPVLPKRKAAWEYAECRVKELKADGAVFDEARLKRARKEGDAVTVWEMINAKGGSRRGIYGGGALEDTERLKAITDGESSTDRKSLSQDGSGCRALVRRGVGGADIPWRPPEKVFFREAIGGYSRAHRTLFESIHDFTTLDTDLVLNCLKLNKNVMEATMAYREGIVRISESIKRAIPQKYLLSTEDQTTKDKIDDVFEQYVNDESVSIRSDAITANIQRLRETGSEDIKRLSADVGNKFGSKTKDMFDSMISYLLFQRAHSDENADKTTEDEEFEKLGKEAAEALGVNMDASIDAIQRAFRRKVKDMNIDQTKGLPGQENEEGLENNKRQKQYENYRSILLKLKEQELEPVANTTDSDSDSDSSNMFSDTSDEADTSSEDILCDQESDSGAPVAIHDLYGYTD
ncbi:hypothetical protein [Parendozoicomonas sp. Alg238-R29]|uniref:hypothetical protein n=1 Tax=Parendozoicomonas sp. Alg238-R29 TaxID=2993446 RepID=UPI00248E6B1C|nr:hypothetical protein [Parendozoicomonas sp. Alg238-R29]